MALEGVTQAAEERGAVALASACHDGSFMSSTGPGAWPVRSGSANLAGWIRSGFTSPHRYAPSTSLAPAGGARCVPGRENLPALRRGSPSTGT